MVKTVDLSQFQKEQHQATPTKGTAKSEENSQVTEPSKPIDEKINTKKGKGSQGIKKDGEDQDRFAQLWAAINELTKEFQILKQNTAPNLSAAMPQEIFQDLVTVLDECWTRYVKWGYGPKSLKVKMIADYFKISLEDPAKLLAQKDQTKTARKKTTKKSEQES